MPVAVSPTPGPDTPAGQLPAPDRARELLEAARHGTLCVASSEPGRLTRAQQDTVLFVDAGEPCFVAESGTLLARAGADNRRGVFEVDAVDARAVFDGRLRIAATQHVDGEIVHIVRLSVTRVQLVDAPARRRRVRPRS